VRLIAHDASMNKHLSIAKIGRIKIHDNCFLGDSVIILSGVSIGPNAIIGAGSVVARDIPPNSVAAGNPAKFITSFDEFMKRHNDNMDKYRCFSLEQYNIAVISNDGKEEMLSYLEKYRIAYMKRLSK
jgi:maltose O-acetyltransferase